MEALSLVPISKPKWSTRPIARHTRMPTAVPATHRHVVLMPPSVGDSGVGRQNRTKPRAL